MLNQESKGLDLVQNSSKSKNQHNSQSKLKQDFQNYQGSQQSDQYNEQDEKQWKRNLLSTKPFDLKALWLGNTDQLIRQFDQTLKKVQKQKESLNKGLQLFQQNHANYQKNSLRRMHFQFDKKKIYQQFMQKSRKPIQKLSPGILLNIGSYVQKNLFFFLAKMRRVSKVFNFIYKNEEVVRFLGEKDLGQVQSLVNLQKICAEWLSFERTFLYYKEIKYTQQIPPNSFKVDLQRAVNFINDIYKRIFRTRNFELGYFIWLNTFMKIHRIVIALSTLSLTNLIMIRKLSIVAFSNYLALNPSERKKEEITKTKYSQVIKIVQDENYKHCLIINTKVSNYLLEQHQYDFAVYIIHSLTGKCEPKGAFLDELFTYNILLIHKYNDQKSKFQRDIFLTNGNVLDSENGICVQFKEENLSKCSFSIRTNTTFDSYNLEGNFTNCLIRDQEAEIKFSEAFIYNQEYHYLIVIKNLLNYYKESPQ